MSIPTAKRTLVIGDIHGLLKPLENLLSKLNYSSSRDQIIFLGDYVDRGLQSAEVVSFLIEFKKEAIHKPIFLLGNHDLWCREWLNLDIISDQWLKLGGMETLESYDHLPIEDLKLHKSFFNQLVDFHIQPDGKAFVHGGYESLKGLGHDATAVYCNSRTLARYIGEHSNSEIPENELNPAIRFYKELYLGHTPTLRFEQRKPIHLNNRFWLMDTGVVHGGKLSALDIKSKEFFQSKKRSKLYPLYD